MDRLSRYLKAFRSLPTHEDNIVYIRTDAIVTLSRNARGSWEATLWGDSQTVYHLPEEDAKKVIED